jgi:hypothetical protein
MPIKFVRALNGRSSVPSISIRLFSYCMHKGIDVSRKKKGFIALEQHNMATIDVL